MLNFWAAQVWRRFCREKNEEYLWNKISDSNLLSKLLSAVCFFCLQSIQLAFMKEENHPNHKRNLLS